MHRKTHEGWGKHPTSGTACEILAVCQGKCLVMPMATALQGESLRHRTESPGGCQERQPLAAGREPRPLWESLDTQECWEFRGARAREPEGG